ncbi:MAG TPA: hypothetical protein VMU05_06105 [Dongiaceae bacterium]|nr:hypothetical protein [Dongiaceae bacterium]
MRSVVGLIVSSLVLLAIVCYTWMHIRHSADSVELQAGPILKQAHEAQQTYAEAQDAKQTVTLAGPVANFLNRKDGSKIEVVRTSEHKTVASDHVGGSVVGTSMTVLKDKFRVSGTMDLPFEVPAHAATPQFHGTFSSFVQAGKPTSDADSDVDFRLLTDEEFSNFVDQRPSEALFSADATHNQEVNVNLPPTLTKPATYHMVFMNNSRKTKKVVEADFRIDF